MISIPHVKEEQYQFVVQFLLDICCIPHVDKANVNEVYYEEVPVKTNPPAASTENKDAKAQEGAEQKAEAPKTEKVKKERSHVCMIKVSECTYGNSQQVLDVSFKNNLKNFNTKIKSFTFKIKFVNSFNIFKNIRICIIESFREYY